jgi:hypothetical protein
MTIDRSGVYRHRRGRAKLCGQILAGKVRSIADHGRLPGIPPPEVHREPCLYCGEMVETDPGGLCPACLGKKKVEEESR